MIVLYNATAIPNHPGEYALATAIYDEQQFQMLRTALAPGYGVLLLDQSEPGNRAAAADVWNTLGQVDFRGLGKYYIYRPGRTLWQRGNWKPRTRGQYTPTADEMVPLTSSGERTDFEDNLQAALDRLDEIVSGAVAPGVAVRDLARILKRILRLQRRLLRADD